MSFADDRKATAFVRRPGHHDRAIIGHAHALQRLEVSRLLGRVRRRIDQYRLRQWACRLFHRDYQAVIIDLRQSIELGHLAADLHPRADDDVVSRLAAEKDGDPVRRRRIAVRLAGDILNIEGVIDVAAGVLVLVAADDHTTKVDKAIEIRRHVRRALNGADGQCVRLGLRLPDEEYADDGQPNE